MSRTPKRPRDTNQLAKSILDLATGEIEEEIATKKQMNTAKAGKKGGKARAKILSPQKRSEIAQIGAQARWKKARD